MTAVTLGAIGVALGRFANRRDQRRRDHRAQALMEKVLPEDQKLESPSFTLYLRPFSTTGRLQLPRVSLFRARVWANVQRHGRN